MSVLATSSVSDYFIDQKVAEGIFKEALQEKGAYRVLNYYGANGVGKSKFKEYLEYKYIDKKELFGIELNFNNRLLHNPKNAIMYIAKELEAQFNFNFLALWKAYAILWHKRFEKSLIMYAADLPYIAEIKKLVEEERKNRSLLRIMKGLFKPSIAKELEELKSLDTQEIEARLYKFFASDLQTLIKQHNLKDFIFFIDSYELIYEKEAISPCDNDRWIRDLVLQIGRDALFVIFSSHPIEWERCNVTWKTQIKFYELEKFKRKDAIRYLQESGIKDIKLKEAIVVSSASTPFWLSLAKYAYFKKEDKLPAVKHDILNSFLINQKSEIIRLLKILSHTRFFTKDIIKKISIYFNIPTNTNLLIELTSFDFIKEIGNNRYVIDKVLREELIELEDEEKNRDYQIFLFGYYEDLLHSLDKEKIKNTPEFIDEVLEEAWYYLTTISDEPLVHFEWLDYYVSRFFLYAAWEPFIYRYKQIIPKLKAKKDDLSKEKLITLYNNLAGLYESIGENRLAKLYYIKVAKLNRPELLKV
ncbi:MAG: hypothetical protein GXN91_03880 [Epsilonproteobacteria bacterium]|nr:hypothetical protein [Campylobacterota bacterium]